MRGSPLIRFVLLAIALMITAAGLLRVTSAKAVEISPIRTDKPQPAAASGIPFRLLLSAPATTVEINTSQPLKLSPQEMPISGRLALDMENPHLSLMVRWKNLPAAGEHRFAKLTLEVPGQATVTHVFDAHGDIDDFLELPLPAAAHD